MRLSKDNCNHYYKNIQGNAVLSIWDFTIPIVTYKTVKKSLVTLRTLYLIRMNKAKLRGDQLRLLAITTLSCKKYMHYMYFINCLLTYFEKNNLLNRELHSPLTKGKPIKVPYRSSNYWKKLILHITHLIKVRSKFMKNRAQFRIVYQIHFCVKGCS